MRATLGRPWQLGLPCAGWRPEASVFIQLSLRSSSPAAQGQGKVLARLSAGLPWHGPGLIHCITKGKSRLRQEKMGLCTAEMIFVADIQKHPHRHRELTPTSYLSPNLAK